MSDKWQRIVGPSSCSPKSACKPCTLKFFLSFESLPETSHVADNIGIGVPKALGLDHPLACVIGRCDQPKIAMKLGYQISQMANSTGNVLLQITAVLDAKSSGCFRHELHQPCSPFVGNRAPPPCGFLLDQSTHELNWDTVVLGVGGNVVFRFLSVLVICCATGSCKHEKHQQLEHLHGSIASWLYCCASWTRLAHPSRSKSFRLSASVLARRGSRMSRISGVISCFPSTSSARAKSSISEIEGGFSRLQPRRAFASPAMLRWNSAFWLGILSSRILASRSGVGWSIRR